jgi:Fur family ferric uptake transcriptional regulator
VSADPAALLRQRGIHVTAQRLAVLRAVASAPHVTADSIADAVRAQIGAISLQSVYDALGLLVEEGLIRRIQPAGSPARFEDRIGDNHHHLIDCAVAAAPCLSPSDEQGYQVDEAEVIFWGRCPDCQPRSRRASHSTPRARGRRTRRRIARAR